MTRKVTATEAKAKILGLLDDVSAGDEIEITKHGRTVAKLIPARGPASLKAVLKDVAVSEGDDEQLFTTGLDWNLADADPA
jgi:prevent-host-death family protein